MDVAGYDGLGYFNIDYMLSTELTMAFDEIGRLERDSARYSDLAN